MIIKKTADDLKRLHKAGQIVARAHEELYERLRPGMSTMDLDVIAEEVIVKLGGVPSFKGYHGFPATLCTSPNDQIVHGIPSGDVVLNEGDLISIDCGAIYEGFHGDSAVTWIVGDAGAVSPADATLVTETRRALWQGIVHATDGNRLGDVGAAIEAVAVEHDLGVVREYVGHGVGRSLHEDPSVPNYGRAGKGLRISSGWVIAIEPMFNLGTEETLTLEDGWTVVTVDGARSAHWEHTVAVTPDGPWVLTARHDEPQHPLTEGLPAFS